MNWNDVRFFLEVARAGTLSGAAKVLGASQPTVGRRIQSLEKAIGQRLFQRSSEGFWLTDEGLMMLGFAQRMESETLALSRSLQGQDQELSGSIKVSSSDWFGSHVLSPMFTEFLALHPKLMIELVTDSRPFNLNRREADLAFRILPFEDPDIVQRKVLTMKYGVYAAAALDWQEVGTGAGMQLITMDSQFGSMPDVLWLKQHFPDARVIFTSNNRIAQAQVCSLGKGLAVLPELLGDHYPGLKRVEVGEHLPSRDVWMGYHQDFRHLLRLRALITFITEALQRDPSIHLQNT
ncbi:LysR family transcriptional regulator [Shewanella salipaludis]|uniref:LysR family transcriptional regulator n=1 Tax=Shewanella salipaludis TaxID=2723052 RepID=A0A972JJY1_9GAMM|nr:LysR family transcriptional regulator [Shewanella salipaludis]NMH65630.1 LysR family transcriptional regulator [Shewanella salipaludis]